MTIFYCFQFDCFSNQGLYGFVEESISENIYIFWSPLHLRRSVLHDPKTSRDFPVDKHFVNGICRPLSLVLPLECSCEISSNSLRLLYNILFVFLSFFQLVDYLNNGVLIIQVWGVQKSKQSTSNKQMDTKMAVATSQSKETDNMVRKSFYLLSLKHCHLCQVGNCCFFGK